MQLWCSTQLCNVLPILDDNKTIKGNQNYVFYEHYFYRALVVEHEKYTYILYIIKFVVISSYNYVIKIIIVKKLFYTKICLGESLQKEW